MKIGTAITSQSPNEAMRIGVLAERLGFHSLWVTDHLIDTGGVKVEPWTTISAIATKTKKLVLASAVTDAYRAHPARTAHTIATLDEISGGRVWLGIGAGEAMNTLPFGMEFERPLERVRRLEEAIRVIRLLWGSSRSNPVSFHGRHFALDNAWLDIRIKKPPPIYIGSLGGRHALEVVGKHGDGWVTWINSPESFTLRFDRIEKIARPLGRKVNAAVWLYTTLTQDRRRLRAAINLTKRTMLSEAHTLRLLGFALPEDAKTPYQSLLVSDRNDRMLERIQEAVPDELALRFLASGSPSAITERIEEYRKAGATHVIAHFLEPAEGAMREYSRTVFPYFKKE